MGADYSQTLGSLNPNVKKLPTVGNDLAVFRLIGKGV
jgi:hypothetical protein